jgi:broad specificity phosphatase PhoE
MVTTFLLIRHGSTELVGKALAGRLPGVFLDATGRLQAQALAKRLESRSIAAVYSSPLERAVETAEPLARLVQKQIRIREGFTEIGFGEWSGKTLPDLQNDPEWSRFNTQRGHVPARGGELMLEAQARMARELETLRRIHPEDTLAIFSHADMIKAALLLYLGSPLDHHLRLDISPASVSVLELAEWGPRVVSINS